ncbi:MAG: MATE family efflux transporter [Paracoccaceae bacterium]|nr:MAG: MATE family efflux transporter [Paracoccaceae bacterium]
MTLAAIRAEMPGTLRLSLPIVAGMAASTLLGVTDTIMLAPLGAVPLAGAGLAFSFSIIVGATVYGLISGVPMRIGAAFGARRGRSLTAMVKAGLVLGALVGAAGALAMVAAWPLLPLFGQPPEVLAILFPYWCLIAGFTLPFAMLIVLKSVFESVGRPWIGTAFAYLGAVLNVPLNYVLIWGAGPIPPLGLTGAGIGSVLAETLALAAALAWWRLAPSTRRLRLRGRLDWSEVRAGAREGAPMGMMYLAETGALTVLTLIIGTFGAVALAANQVAMSVGGLIYMLPLGIAQAVAIRVAQARGAGEPDRLRPVVWSGLLAAMLWLGGAMVLLAAGGRAIAATISPDPEVVALAAVIFVVFAAMQLFDGIQSTMVGALRGLSASSAAARVSTLCFWGLGLPAAWVLAHDAGLGVPGVWGGWLAAQIVAGGLLVAHFLRLTRLSAGADRPNLRPATAGDCP